MARGRLIRSQAEVKAGHIVGPLSDDQLARIILALEATAPAVLIAGSLLDSVRRCSTKAEQKHVIIQAFRQGTMFVNVVSLALASEGSVTQLVAEIRRRTGLSGGAASDASAADNPLPEVRPLPANGKSATDD